jgi:hypothetical protein
MKHAALGLLLTAISLIAGAPEGLEWKTGTLLATAQTQQELGTMARSHASGMTMGTGGMNMGQMNGTSSSSVRYATWRGYAIKGDGMNFTVTYRLKWRHFPNLTVNGPVKYAVKKDKFYLVDEDGKSFELSILEKALPQP